MYWRIYFHEVLKKLGNIKNTNPALHGGKQAASYTSIKTNNDNVLLFKRSKNANTVTFLANMSNQEQSIDNILKGKYLDYMSDTKIGLTTETITLKPWEYKILIE